MHCARSDIEPKTSRVLITLVSNSFTNAINVGWWGLDKLDDGVVYLTMFQVTVSSKRV